MCNCKPIKWKLECYTAPSDPESNGDSPGSNLETSQLSDSTANDPAQTSLSNSNAPENHNAANRETDNVMAVTNTSPEAQLLSIEEQQTTSQTPTQTLPHSSPDVSPTQNSFLEQQTLVVT